MIMNLSYAATGTVIIDIVAIFLLLGIIQCSRIYRQRGKLQDKLFFSMLILDIFMAVFDIAVEFSNYGITNFARFRTVLLATILTLIFEVLCYMVLLYVLCFLPAGSERVKKNSKKYAIPMFVANIVIILNMFFGYLFYSDAATGQYLHGPVYNIIFIPVVIYAVMTLSALWKINKLGVLLFFLLLVARITLEVLYRSVSSTPFVYAVVLIYLLLGTMNRAFHGEDE